MEANQFYQTNAADDFPHDVQFSVQFNIENRIMEQGLLHPLSRDKIEGIETLTKEQTAEK